MQLVENKTHGKVTASPVESLTKAIYGVSNFLRLPRPFLTTFYFPAILREGEYYS